MSFLCVLVLVVSMCLIPSLLVFLGVWVSLVADLWCSVLGDTDLQTAGFKGVLGVRDVLGVLGGPWCPCPWC